MGYFGAALFFTARFDSVVGQFLFTLQCVYFWELLRDSNFRGPQGVEIFLYPASFEPSSV